MKLLSRKVKRRVRWLTYKVPRSRILSRLAQMYLDNCRGVNNADMIINGESALLRAVGSCLSSPVLDIGSNVGQWARLLIESGCVAPIHCFEPAPASLKLLQAASSPPWVNLHGAAMGAGQSEMRLNIVSKVSELNSFYPLRKDGQHESILVRVNSVDAFCQEQKIEELSFVKVDVEGHEVSVIEGSRRMLVSGAIGYFQFEYGAGWIQARRQLRDVFEIICETGLHLHRIVPWGLESISEYDSRLEDYRHANYVLIQEDNLDGLFKRIGRFVNPWL